MGDADDIWGETAEPSPMPEDVARHIRSWARTIERWSLRSGETCFLLTEEIIRVVGPGDLSEAVDKLHLRRPGPEE